MEKLKLDFYYGREAEQFTFYRLPKVLITDKRFKDLSDSAKILYGLMLDRMTLSMRNGWYDEENRVYIKYSFSGIMEDMNCAKEKASKMLKELEEIGLIWRVTQIGHASIIYVKNFVTDTDEVAEDRFENRTGSENEPVDERPMEDERTSTETEPVRNYDRFDNQTSGGSEIELEAVRNSNPNNIFFNNTDVNKTNQINPIDEGDMMEEAAAYMELIRENINYDEYMECLGDRDKELYDELYQLICEVICVPRKSIRIAGEEYPYNLVKGKFLKLNSQHLQYVIGCMERNTTKVANIKAYLITALYNAPNTMNHYYTAEVNHDIFRGSKTGNNVRMV